MPSFSIYSGQETSGIKNMDSKCEGVREPPSVPSEAIKPVLCCGTQRFPDGARGTIDRALIVWLESQSTDQLRDQRGDSKGAVHAAITRRPENAPAIKGTV